MMEKGRWNAPAPIPILDKKQEWQTFAPGLGRVNAVLNTLGNPHLKYQHILVGGTNGKGTVCTNLSRSAPGKVGLFTSPHIFDVRERIKINGEMVSDQIWKDAYNGIQAAISTELSYFEWLLVIAVVIFEKEQVQHGIFEIGLGGRLDAANALSPHLSVLTNVSWDHKEILGDTISEIAMEKIEIARPKQTFVLPEEIADIVCVSSRLKQIGCKTTTLKTKGRFEDNWTFVDQVCNILGWTPAKPRVIPQGRQVKLENHLYVDGSHNQASWLACREWLEQEGIETINILASLSKGRSPYEFLEVFSKIAKHIYTTEIGFESELPSSFWPSNVQQIKWNQLEDLVREPLLVCGSLYLIGPFLRLYNK